MNKKLILLVLLVFGNTFLRGAELQKSDSGIDFDKINGTKPEQKPIFASIESTMKELEGNILKLMRELGELKMQFKELKSTVQKELDEKQAMIEKPASDPVKQVLDDVSTPTTSQILPADQ